MSTTRAEIDTEPRSDDRSQTPPPSGPGRGTGRTVIVTLLSALALVLAGVGTGWLIWGAGGEETSSTIAESATSVSEPVAAVAQSLLPTVVQLESSDGLGSGVIYDTDGLILTAAHVVGTDESVTVRLANGDQLSGEVVGADANSDIAVIRIDRTGLDAAPLAVDVTVAVGQTAVALGSPYGLEQTVTAGVVSAVERSLVGSDDVVRTAIQTDAAINPGNSGGPLANLDGQVIGINDAIFSESGGNEGVGFAVPITVAKHVADLIVAGEPIEVAYLGVSGTDATDGSAGVIITEVVSGSPADTAGLQAGDLITKFDGVSVESMVDLAAQVRAHQPGEEVTIQVERNGGPVELTSTLGTNG